MKKRARLFGWLIPLIIGLSCPLPILPCSTLVLFQKGFPVFATNYDNAFAPGQIFINKRGVRKTGWEAGTKGRVAAWTSRYGSVTIACAGYQLAWGGMNEAGLAFSTMFLKETKVPPPDERASLIGTFWWQYALDTCATVEDLVKAAEQIRISSTVDHYLVCDRTGACAVVECLNGRLMIRTGKDLTVPVLTNDPYQKCLDRWKTRSVSSPLPYNSFNRFSRLADGVSGFQAGGSAATVEKAFDLLAGVANDLITRWSFVCDTESGVFHFRTYGNPKVRFIDLKKLDFDCARPVLMLDAHADLEDDVSGAFREYSHDEVYAHLVKALQHFSPGVPEETVRKILALFESFTCGPAGK